jgi:hypothetical protein
MVEMSTRDIEIGGNARFYSVGLLTLYAVALALVVLPSVLLWRSGELWPVQWIVADQTATGAIWSAGLVADESGYKRALVKANRPQVVVAGSSRVLGIRRNAFNVPFVNFGRGFDAVNFDRDLLKLADLAQPKILLWGIDHQLPARRYQNLLMAYRGKAGKLDQSNVDGAFFPEIIPRSVMTIWGLLVQQQISPIGTLSVILRGAYFEGPRLGLRANLGNLGGYGADGSYHYLDAFARPRTALDKLTVALKKMRESTARDQDSISAQTMDRIQTTVEGLQRRGITVVLFLTPLPSQHPVTEHERAYLDDLRRELTSISENTMALFFDYLDARAIGVQDKEFIDATHAGEVAMLKLLGDMGKHSEAVRRVLRTTHIEGVIERHSGEATLTSPLYRQLGLKRLEPVP